MPLVDDVVEKLSAKRWSQQCVEIVLNRHSPEDQRRFIGPGTIEQTSTGAIRVVAYAKEVVGYTPASFFDTTGVPGQLIKGNQFYELRLRTFNGDEWFAERVLPQISVSEAGDGPFYVCEAYVGELTWEGLYPAAYTKHLCRLDYLCDIEIPCNASTETSLSVAGRRRHRRSELNVARFELSEGQFTLVRHAGRISVSIESEVAFPDSFESYVTEALSVTLATPLRAAVMQRLGGGVDRVVATGYSVNGRSRLARPINEDVYIGEEICETWRFFGAYLSFLIRSGRRTYHPYTTHLVNSLVAAERSFAAAALALAIAAEGIVKGVVSDAGEMSASAKKSLESARSYLRAWGGSGDVVSDGVLRRRLDGISAKLGECSAKDRFYRMVAACVLDKRHVKAWDKVRNAFAHGRCPDVSETEEVLRCMWVILGMVYRLLFSACGYRGWFTDTSITGFPRRVFRGRAPNEEEIATAAYYLWQGGQGACDSDRWEEASKALRDGRY